MTESEDIIWQNTVDQGTWEVAVRRTGDYTGELTVVRASDQQTIHTQEVGLAYRAIFGPDVDDLAQWREICIQVIDKQEE